MSDRSCSVDDCERDRKVRGWCKLHYERMQNTGRLDLAPRPNRRPCEIDGCEGVSGAKGTARGLCSKHYTAWSRHGDPLKAGRQPMVAGSAPCSVDGCELLVRTRGWCVAHYSNWLRHGEVTPRKRGEVRDGKKVCPRCKVDTPVENIGKTYCRPCALAYTVAYQTEFPETVWRHAAARRARINQARLEDFDRLEIFERDHWICQICNRPVDREKPWRKPTSPSLDHIVPVARGGEHSRANAQTACLRCNMRKGPALHN